MASDTLIPFSEGKVAQDARADDEEEMRRLRAAAGGATRVGTRRSKHAALSFLLACNPPRTRVGLMGEAVQVPFELPHPTSRPSPQTAKRQAYLAGAAAAAAEEDPELRAELDAAAVPA